MKRIVSLLIISTFGLSACDKTGINNPHRNVDARANYVYASFSEPPKTLDPAKSYSSDEIRFTAQIYEPLVQYDYYARPYKLIPLTAEKMPAVRYLDQKGQTLSKEAPSEDIAYSVYRIQIKPGILFQPHPAFAKDEQGHYLYHHLSDAELEKVYSVKDFAHTGTRELTVDDYIYELKRLADPMLHSPIFGVMARYIDGLSELNASLDKIEDKTEKPVDLRQYTLRGVKKINEYEFEITLKGKYPQFVYWLAMPFFAPVPWEADAFYHQPGMASRNLTMSWYPIGTGPYMLTKNNPNDAMVLSRNPNFRGERFPVNSSETDVAHGYSKDAGERIPFVDKFVYVLEKESIPRWTKFLQGYYDSSAISSDSFDQAIQVDSMGNVDLTPELKDKNINLQTIVSPSIFYLGFNMLDPVVGGSSERAKWLRQAISIAVDYREYIAIFMNGRGVPAEGPIPPGIVGYTDQQNPVTHASLAEAKALMEKAGYPGGVDPKTGQALVLHYDVTASSGPDDKARFDWMRKQFAKLGIELNIRSTQYNRFQEKMRTGNAQIFSWGWNADYPDPENFLFLLYGPNGKMKTGGENAANYDSPIFNALFEKMRNMENGPVRQKIIDEMVQVVQNDAPWVWGVNPKDFVLSHQWVRPTKPNSMANNTAKYIKVYPHLRKHLRHLWNHPVWWPLWFIGLLMIVILVPVTVSYHRRQRRPLKSQ